MAFHFARRRELTFGLRICLLGIGLVIVKVPGTASWPVPPRLPQTPSAYPCPMLLQTSNFCCGWSTAWVSGSTAKECCARTADHSVLSSRDIHFSHTRISFCTHTATYNQTDIYMRLSKRVLRILNKVSI